MKRIITDNMVKRWIKTLITEEKSRNTVEKYARDVRAFQNFLDGRPVTKELVLAYKADLIDRYAVRSVNSMLIAINRLFSYLGWYDMRVKVLKLQRQIFCPEERELSKSEYERLVRATRENGNERLEMVMQTICGTGIRIGELRFITVEAAKSGVAVVSLKGKIREILIVKKLKVLLLNYAKKLGIKSGPIFITRSGKPVSRVNVWREMKISAGWPMSTRRRSFPTISVISSRRSSTRSTEIFQSLRMFWAIRALKRQGSILSHPEPSTGDISRI